MKITKQGIILACKDVGSYLLAYTFAGITADIGQFSLGLATFALINIPTDLFLMNKWNHDKKPS